MPIDPNDRLALDCARDLERIDAVVTQIINNRQLWDEFKRDPNGVCVQLGLHPPTSPEINDRANRIFYATLTNKALIDFLSEQYSNFSSTQMEDYQSYFVEGLKKGVLQNRVELDLEAADHVFRQPDALKKLYQISLHDLNDRGLFTRHYALEEIDRYIDSLVDAIGKRAPRAELPRLEEWDRSYGVGAEFGVVAEVGPVATVEAVAAATIAIPVEVLGLSEQTTIREQFTRAALGGDIESSRAAATLGRLIDLGADLLLHANTFEASR